MNTWEVTWASDGLKPIKVTAHSCKLRNVGGVVMYLLCDKKGAAVWVSDIDSVRAVRLLPPIKSVEKPSIPLRKKQ